MQKKKSSDVKVTSKEVDKKLVEKKQKEFDTMYAIDAAKKYEIELNSSAVTGLLDFFDDVQWKGYECYGIEKIYDTIIPELNELSDNEFELKMQLDADVVEAMFYFIKSHLGKGITAARSFRELTDGFSKVMQEINIDREVLRNVALELTAAEQGLTVDELQDSYKQEEQTE